MVSDGDMLVPGRECGGCTVCCKVPKIDVPELKKLAGVVCEHCVLGTGCKIYERRPPVCQRWHCGWRSLPQLGEEWRPDRCGVLVCIVGKGEGIPPEFRQVGLKFDVVDSPRVLMWDPLLKFIGSEVERRHPVFLGVPSPIGYERRKVFLNYSLANAVASRQRLQMIDGLVNAFQLGLQDGLKEKTAFS